MQIKNWHRRDSTLHSWQETNLTGIFRNMCSRGWDTLIFSCQRGSGLKKAGFYSTMNAVGLVSFLLALVRTCAHAHLYMWNPGSLLWMAPSWDSTLMVRVRLLEAPTEAVTQLFSQPEQLLPSLKYLSTFTQVLLGMFPLWYQHKSHYMAKGLYVYDLHFFKLFFLKYFT